MSQGHMMQPSLDANDAITFLSHDVISWHSDITHDILFLLFFTESIPLNILQTNADKHFLILMTSNRSMLLKHCNPLLIALLNLKSKNKELAKENTALKQQLFSKETWEQETKTLQEELESKQREMEQFIHVKMHELNCCMSDLNACWKSSNWLNYQVIEKEKNRDILCQVTHPMQHGRNKWLQRKRRLVLSSKLCRRAVTRSLIKLSKRRWWRSPGLKLKTNYIWPSPWRKARAAFCNWAQIEDSSLSTWSPLWPSLEPTTHSPQEEPLGQSVLPDVWQWNQATPWWQRLTLGTWNITSLVAKEARTCVEDGARQYQ